MLDINYLDYVFVYQAALLKVADDILQDITVSQCLITFLPVGVPLSWVFATYQMYGINNNEGPVARMSAWCYITAMVLYNKNIPSGQFRIRDPHPMEAMFVVRWRHELETLSA